MNFLLISLLFFMCFGLFISYVRIIRRRKKRRERIKKQDNFQNAEMSLIKAFKNNDFFQCASLLKKIEEEGVSSEIIESLKPKILEKLKDENINIS